MPMLPIMFGVYDFPQRQDSRYSVFQSFVVVDLSFLYPEVVYSKTVANDVRESECGL